MAEIDEEMLRLACMYTDYRGWSFTYDTCFGYSGKYIIPTIPGDQVADATNGKSGTWVDGYSFSFPVQPIGPVLDQADAIREILRAIELTERHERLEHFRFDGNAIFNPHRVMS